MEKIYENLCFLSFCSENIAAIVFSKNHVFIPELCIFSNFVQIMFSFQRYPDGVSIVEAYSRSGEAIKRLKFIINRFPSTSDKQHLMRSLFSCFACSCSIPRRGRYTNTCMTITLLRNSLHEFHTFIRSAWCDKIRHQHAPNHISVQKKG